MVLLVQFSQLKNLYIPKDREDRPIECTKIGYSLMSDKSIKIQQFPTTISKVPSELPKHITNLNNAFDENENEIIKGIESWNTENVVDMQQMFSEARKFNQNLSRWNVSKISKSITFNSEIYSGWHDFNKGSDKEFAGNKIPDLQEINFQDFLNN